MTGADTHPKADGSPRNKEEGRERFWKNKNTSLESKSDFGRVWTRRTFTPLVKLLCEEQPTERESISKYHLTQNKLFSSLHWRNTFCCGDVCVAEFGSLGTGSIWNQRRKTEVNLKKSDPISMFPIFSWQESDHVELMISFSPVETGKPRESSQEKKGVQVHGGKLFSFWAAKQWQSGHWFSIRVAQQHVHCRPVLTTMDSWESAGQVAFPCCSFGTCKTNVGFEWLDCGQPVQKIN